MMINLVKLLFVSILITININKLLSLEIIFALNAGGDAFTDSLGIRYRRDFLNEGTPSDYGKILDIKRVSPQDKVLYQTERYAQQTFGYTIPMPPNDGDYVLWLKFCEVWFNAARLKVFDVALNDVVVIKNLDIYEKVGRGVAHDEVVPFQVKQGKIVINGKISQFSNEIRVDFIKTDHDNPKVNAIIVMKGTPDQVPQLPPYIPEKTFDEFEDVDNLETDMSAGHDEDDDDEGHQHRRQEQHQQQHNEEENRRNQGKKQQKKRKTTTNDQVVDPYASDENSYLLPVLVCIGALIPILFCLCRI